jgi:hypothetical protein
VIDRQSNVVFEMFGRNGIVHIKTAGLLIFRLLYDCILPPAKQLEEIVPSSFTFAACAVCPDQHLASLQ